MIGYANVEQLCLSWQQNCRHILLECCSHVLLWLAWRWTCLCHLFICIYVYSDQRVDLLVTVYISIYITKQLSTMTWVYIIGYISTQFKYIELQIFVYVLVFSYLAINRYNIACVKRLMVSSTYNHFAHVYNSHIQTPLRDLKKFPKKHTSYICNPPLWRVISPFIDYSLQ